MPASAPSCLQYSHSAPSSPPHAPFLFKFKEWKEKGELWRHIGGQRWALPNTTLLPVLASVGLRDEPVLVRVERERRYMRKDWAINRVINVVLFYWWLL